VKYVRALDGVRAIAILLTILFHYTWVSCGWIGVQLFFVLSGFLITSVLLSDSDLPLVSYLKRFYWRRTLRIFPLYFGYLLVLAAVYAATRQPAVFARSWAYLFTYTLNFQRLVPGFVNSPFFGHFWSLALEEQFYVVWPLAIYLLARRGRLVLIGTLIILCPAIRALTAVIANSVSHNAYYVGQAVYSFTFSQLDAFATGAALAIFREKLPGRPMTWLAFTTAALVAGGQFATWLARGHLALNSGLGYEINMLQSGLHVWGYSLINLWSAALIFTALDDNVLARRLSHPAAVYIGRISYGMYLFHLPVLAGMGALIGRPHGLGNLLAFGAYLAALVAICSLVYRYYESYFLGMKYRLYGRTRPVRLSLGKV